MTTYRRIASRIANRLWADLQSGKVTKVGIDEIRAAIKLEPDHSEFPFDRLEEIVVRRLVEKVG